MRTIKSLAIPQDDSVQFPFSTIKNETDTEVGTPVVREVYGDVLTNIYKLLQTVGITPTATEDSDLTQYQILEALKKLPNSLNDIEQTLTLTGSVWSVPFNLTYLPSKYFFIARASSGYVNGSTYTFKGTGATEYGFTSSGFNASDEVLVIIDTAGVRAYSLSKLTETPSQIFTVMGMPLPYNDSNKLWYQNEGKLISDYPTVNDVEAVIRVDVSNGTVIVKDMFIVNGWLLCFCLTPATNTYFFRRLLISDLSISLSVAVTAGFNFGNSTDYNTHVYVDGNDIYATNWANNSTDDENIYKYLLDINAGTIEQTVGFTMDASFVKTSNAVIKSGFLYTLVSGQLDKYNLTNGVKTSIATYTDLLGNLFKFNGEVYFTAGQVANKWTI